MDIARPDSALAAMAMARLVGLEIPAACLPGVIEGLAALEAHVRTLEAPEIPDCR